MENILKQAADLFDLVAKKSAALDAERAEVKTQSETCRALIADNAELQKDLERREAEVKKVEDIQALLAESRDLRAKAVAALNEANAAQQKLREETEAANAAIALERSKVNQDRSAVDRGFRELVEAQKAFAEEKKNMKAQVLKEVGAKLGV